MKKPIVKISKRLERGTTVWLVICTLIIFIPRAYMRLNPPEHTFYWEYNLPTKKHTIKQHSGFISKANSIKLWKRCRPEMLTLADWQRLGLSPKQASSLLKYRDKYGFHSLAQMQQIRVLDAFILSQIQDSLVFENTDATTPWNHLKTPQTNKEANSNPSPRNTGQNQFKKLDLNTTTIEELVALPGIGGYTAEKIIYYRQRLGGFLTLEQLAEVKGVNIEMIQKAIPFLEVNTKIQTLDLNSVTIERLKQHPYLSWNQANSIVKIRQQLGSFKSIEQIKQSVLIDAQTFEKLKPYLSL